MNPIPVGVDFAFILKTPNAMTITSTTNSPLTSTTPSPVTTTESPANAGTSPSPHVEENNAKLGEGEDGTEDLGEGEVDNDEAPADEQK